MTPRQRSEQRDIEWERDRLRADNKRLRTALEIALAFLSPITGR